MREAVSTEENDAALVFRANTLSLTIRHVLCGHFDGEWESCIPFARLIYILEAGSGESFIRHENTVADLSPGHWCLIPAGLRVHHVEQPGLRLVSLHFNVKICSNLELLSMLPRLFCGAAPEDETDFSALYEHCHDFSSQFLVRELIWRGVRRATGQLSSSVWSEKISALERFRPLLDALASARYPDFDIDRMAHLMKMGRDSFIRHFSAAMGISPGAFFNRMLADRAAQLLLARPVLQIAEVSDELGFPNEYYFSRFFKRHFSLSPVHYRERAVEELRRNGLMG